MSSCGVSVCPVTHRDEEEEICLLIFFLIALKKVIILCCFLLFYFIEEIIWLNYNLDVNFFPNCPLYYVGAKLSWCQIVRCQIVLGPYCPLLLSWCQIDRFIMLVPNCPVPNCPVPNCPTTPKMTTIRYAFPTN